ncbi:S-layer homology domain-containing protein [Salibacterium salarium]
MVDGYENNTFRPESLLTRAQFAEVLYDLGYHIEPL